MSLQVCSCICKWTLEDPFWGFEETLEACVSISLGILGYHLIEIKLLQPTATLSLFLVKVIVIDYALYLPFCRWLKIAWMKVNDFGAFDKQLFIFTWKTWLLSVNSSIAAYLTWYNNCLMFYVLVFVWSSKKLRKNILNSCRIWTQNLLCMFSRNLTS